MSGLPLQFQAHFERFAVALLPVVADAIELLAVNSHLVAKSRGDAGMAFELAGCLLEKLVADGRLVCVGRQSRGDVGEVGTESGGDCLPRGTLTSPRRVPSNPALSQRERGKR